MLVLLHEAQRIHDDRCHQDLYKPIGCDRGLVPSRSLGCLTDAHICWCGIPMRAMLLQSRGLESLLGPFSGIVPICYETGKYIYLKL